MAEEAYEEAMEFRSGDNDRQIKDESSAAMKEAARPPKAVATQDICGRECPRASDGSLERELMDEAARRFVIQFYSRIPITPFFCVASLED